MTADPSGRSAAAADRQAARERQEDWTRGIRGWFYRSYIGRLREVTLAATGRILDLGCGEDIILAGTPARRIALDLSLIRLRRFTGGQRVCADGLRLPFPAASLSLVLLSAVLEHMVDPATALKETWRALEPGGRALVVVPNDIWMTLGRILIGLWPPRHPDHRHFITPGRLERMARGLRIERAFGLPWPKLPFALNMYWFAVLVKDGGQPPRPSVAAAASPKP